MTVALRSGGPEDAAALHVLYMDAVLNGTAPRYSPEEARAWAPADTPDWIAPRLAAGTTWIAGPGDRGFLTARGDGHLDLFFVRPAERRGPVAPALYDAYAGWCAEAGIDRPTADASRLLRPFLERRGWRIVRRETVRRGGETLERFHMEGPACRGTSGR